MSKLTRSARLLLAVLTLTTALSAQTTPDLDPESRRAVEAALAADSPRAGADAVWRTCVGRHGDIEPVLAELARRMEKPASTAAFLASARLHARLCRQLGDLDRAHRTLRRIDEKNENIADNLAKAEVLDALGRDDEALKSYQRLLAHDLDAELKNRILLRTALMQARGGRLARSLAEFAAEKDRAADLRNQAAIVLALRNHQRDAIELFKVSGDGTRRFQQEIRLAEWAIEARSWKKAQAFAWDAVKSANMKRDRRYALALLVEAYRRDKTLDKLAETFAKAETLDDESRQIWIDLLREMGNVDEALRLFRDSSDGGEFTNDMRRQLLELCRETGREQTLIEAYDKLVSEQPTFIEWREGLARFYLERGNRAAALATWTGHFQATDGTRMRLAAAQSLMKLGLDDEAERFAMSVVGREAVATHAAWLFLFELHKDRGRFDEAATALAELEKVAAPDAGVRMDVADAYARLGDKKRAAAVLQSLRDARGERSAPDADTKLAILYSEIGEEEKAQEIWFQLWRRVESIPRRRFIEDRLMTVASRLGTLARIAVDLEERLEAGKADDREASMLVRLYTRVNDAVSAAEIIEERMRQTQRGSAEVLAEKARLYLSCNDHYNYEQIIRQLVEADPDGRPDHLRELAMSLLERGQRRKAREVLATLKAEEADTESHEFEAGVLSIAGMRDEAKLAYYRSIARHPDRIDTNLLLANLMVELGEKERAAGMFQYLAATAKRDDLFTIAIDGILNLQGDPRRRLPPTRHVAWARRLTLERLAARPNKLYLYQLVADLADEAKDTGMAKRALKASLPIAGEQRTALLRELMDRTRKGNRRTSGLVVIGGSSRGAPKGPKPTAEHLMFGRRLLGQGEVVPPSVYLDLGESFLAAGEVTNASRTFNAASRLPEFDDLQRKIAEAFERAGFSKEALRTYERILTVENRDLELLVKVAELQENLGRDDVAGELFGRGLGLYLSSKPLMQTTEKDLREKSGMDLLYLRSRSLDASEVIRPRLIAGVLATLKDTADAQRLMDELAADIKQDAERLAADPAETRRLGRYPRLAARAAFHRRLCASVGDIARSDLVDGQLIARLPNDDALLDEVVRFRVEWGFRASARKLVAESPASEKRKARLSLRLGVSSRRDLPGLIPVAEASTLVMPLIANADDETLSTLLQRVDLSSGAATDLDHLPILITASLYLGDSDLCLSLLRFWGGVAIGHLTDTAKLSVAVTGLMNQTRQIRILSSAQRASLMEGIVERVASEPDRFSTIIRRLWTLMSVEEGLLKPEQVERLIRTGLASSVQTTYGIPELFGFLPAESRGPVLRRVWPLVAKSQQGYFIGNWVRMNSIEGDPGLDSFILKAFDEGLRNADNPLLVTSAARRLVSDAGGIPIANVTLALRILAVVRERHPKQVMPRANWIHRYVRNGRLDDAWKVGQMLWKHYLVDAKTHQQDIEGIITALGSTHAKELATLCADVENAEVRARLELRLKRYLDAPTMVQVRDLDSLRAIVQATPKDLGALGALKSRLASTGRRFEAAAIQERMLGLRVSSHERRALCSEWISLRNPIRALKVDPGAAGSRKPKPNRPNRRNRPIGRGGSAGSATTIRSSRLVLPGLFNSTGRAVNDVSAIKRALRKKDFETARRLYRNLWRAQSAQLAMARYYGVASRIPARGGSNRPGVVLSSSNPRGGFDPALDQPAAFLSKKPTPWKPPAPDRNQAPFVVAKAPFGADELRRELRSLSPKTYGMPQVQNVVLALTEREVDDDGAEGVISKILARHDAGSASRSDYARLFAMLGRQESRPAALKDDTLIALLHAVGTEGVQLRGLAGIVARFGDAKMASALYRWCAVDLGKVDERTGRPIKQTDQTSLLQEVLSRLSGAPRSAAVAAILRAGSPGRLGTIRSNAGIDRFENEVLTTIAALEGTRAAYTAARPIVDSLDDLEGEPRRLTARTAAGLLARAGEVERAIRLLEIAMCKHPVPTSATYIRNPRAWTNPGRFDDEALRWLFPKALDDWTGASAWYAAVAPKITAWIEAQRIDHLDGYRALCVVAIRAHEAGATNVTGDVLPRLASFEKPHPSHYLWQADVLRHTGREIGAFTIEEKLLEQGRLHPERIPSVVAWVLADRGPEPALALGEQWAQVCLHPDLLDLLIDIARKQNDDARATRWQEVKQAAADATATLAGTAKSPNEKK